MKKVISLTVDSKVLEDIKKLSREQVPSLSRVVEEFLRDFYLQEVNKRGD
jgi:hypothetical protein